MRKVTIIAEAGVNHNGDFELAKQLVDAAAAANCDFVKFQTFKADKIVSKAAGKAEYQLRNVDDGDQSQYAMLKKLEMPDEWHHKLIMHCEKREIQFLSTGFDNDSIDLLHQLKIPFFKVPSGEITNKPYLQHVASKGRPIILSTGMADQAEVAEAIDVLVKAGMNRQQITVLHCNTEYPTPMQDVNLLAMIAMEKELNVAVGYSDHTLGIEVPIAAVALGATVIEKHFTLDRNLSGPDHQASLLPNELALMVKGIRNIEMAIAGSGKKTPSVSELKNRILGRKSIHYAKNFAKGHRINPGDLMMVRPGDGISPMEIDRVIGKTLRIAVDGQSKVSFSDFIDHGN